MPSLPTSTPVPVSGTVSITGSEIVMGTVAVSSVAGTVTTTGLTDTQLRASGVPVTAAALTDGTQRVGGTVSTLEQGGTVVVTGVATSAKQDTGNTSLASVDGKIPALVTGRVPVDPSGVTSPVSLASLPAVAGTVVVSSVGGTVATSGGLTDTQLRAAAVPVSLATLPAGTVTATGPLTDTQLRASVVPVSATAMTDGSQRVGGTVTTAVASATIAALTDSTQRVGGTVTVDSSTLATQASLAALVTATHTDLAAILATSSAATGTESNVASSASNVTLLALNASRKGFSIYNDSTAILYVKFGATATSSSYTVQMAAAAYYESGPVVYTGKIDGIWASATGNARITELT